MVRVPWLLVTLAIPAACSRTDTWDGLVDAEGRVSPSPLSNDSLEPLATDVLIAIADGKLDAVYADRMAKTYRDVVPLARFRAALAKNPYLRGPVKPTVSRSSRTNNYGEVTGSVPTGLGTPPFVVTFVYEGGVPKVTAINIAGSAAIPTYGDFAPGEERALAIDGGGRAPVKRPQDPGY
jgi:hypothetical protein